MRPNSLNYRTPAKALLTVGFCLYSITSVIGQINLDTYYEIVAKHSGKCLDVNGGPVATENGAAIQQFRYNGTDNQKWQFISVGQGLYEIKAKHSFKCLDVTGGPGAIYDGVKIQQYDYLKNVNQMWKLIPLDGGYYRIEAAHSGKSLDVEGGIAARQDGALIQQYAANTGDSQKWALIDLHEPLVTEPTTIRRQDEAYAYNNMPFSGQQNKPAMDRKEILIPNGYSYLQHRVQIATQSPPNGSLSSSTDGVELDENHQIGLVWVEAKTNYKDSFGPNVWIGAILEVALKSTPGVVHIMPGRPNPPISHFPGEGAPSENPDSKTGDPSGTLDLTENAWDSLTLQVRIGNLDPDEKNPLYSPGIFTLTRAGLLHFNAAGEFIMYRVEVKPGVWTRWDRIAVHAGDQKKATVTGGP